MKHGPRLCVLVLSFVAPACGEDTAGSDAATLALGGVKESALATTYYLSPTGLDANSGTSQTSPWRTFARAFNSSRPLKAGDTLVLLDGTYERTTTGLPSINCSATGGNANNGNADAPITIRAQSERRAFLRSDAMVNAFRIAFCSYWHIEGLRVESRDNPNGDANLADVFRVHRGDHITMRRLLGAHNNRFTNSDIFQITQTTTSVIEESEAYYFHRHGITAFESLNVTVRRCYVNSRGYADLHTGDAMYPSGTAPRDGYGPSNCTIRGDGGIDLYVSSQCLVENSISEGNLGFHIIGAHVRPLRLESCWIAITCATGLRRATRRDLVVA